MTLSAHVLACAFLSLSTSTIVQANEIAVKANLTFGNGGGTHPKEFIAGEYADVAVTLSELTENTSGDSKYKMQLDLLNKDNGLLATFPSPDITDTLRLGGGTVRHSATILLPRTLS